MTDDESLLHELTGESTRRSVLKSGALATAGAGLAGVTSGGATAQDDDGLADGQEWDKAIMPVGQFQPNSRFIITSPVLEWSPNVPEIRDNVWSEYNTRAIRYLNTNEQVLFWQAQDAEVPNFNQEAGYVVDAEGDTAPDGNTPQPEVFRMRAQYSPFGDSGYVTVNFTPVGEDEQDDWLDNDDWWYDDEEDQVGIGDDVIDGGNGNATGGNATGGNATGGN